MRVACFVDGNYLNHVIRDVAGGATIAYDRLAEELARPYELLRTYYYDAPPYQGSPPTPDERKRFAAREQFFAMLRRLPKYEVRQGRCQRIADRSEPSGYRYVQKRVDVLLSVDLVRHAATRQI